ncbi:MAG: SagB/ThcOx family dehydrogenase [bacterium]|nr:SagB/ThcOx family dehydrogenase [bacterium]
MKENRQFLKADEWLNFADMDTGQKRKEPMPPLQKPCPADARLIDLVAFNDNPLGDIPLRDAINARKSRRKYSDATLSLAELSFLLWSTQGLQALLAGGKATRRTVPSGGARHAFESYLLINRVEGIEPGLYRYQPLEHQLCFLRGDPEFPERISEACLGQTFVGKGALVFIWSTIPERAEWRYGVVAHKMIAMDVGHVCQNLYLACEAIGAGTCAIGAYDQAKIDALLQMDGEDEYVIYAAPVGKLPDVS